MTSTKEQRRLDILATEEILKKILPMNQDKAVYEISYKTGTKTETLKEYIKAIKAVGHISKDKDNNLIWNKN